MSFKPPTSEYLPRTRTTLVLRVSHYERVAGWLTALLVLVGLVAAVLAVVWLTPVLVFSHVPPSVQLIAYPGQGDAAQNDERDAEVPDPAEARISFEPPSLAAGLDPLTELASSVAASYEFLVADNSGDSDSTTGGRSGDDHRKRQPRVIADDEMIPPWERWEIRYASTSLAEYARQLDFFQIELGGVGGSPHVDYVFDLSSDSPARRRGPSRDEQRIYLSWRSGKLREFDTELVQRAGVETSGRILLQFLPPEVCQRLLELEREHAGARPPREWLRTVFGVRRSGAGYEFFVADQMFRAPPQ